MPVSDKAGHQWTDPLSPETEALSVISWDYQRKLLTACPAITALGDVGIDRERRKGKEREEVQVLEENKSRESWNYFF